MQDLFDMMVKIHQLDRMLLAQNEMTVNMLCLLWALSQASGAMTIGEITAAMGKKCSTMTLNLDRMEERKWITRIRSVADRRVIHIELTPAGMDALQHALVIVRASLTPAS